MPVVVSLWCWLDAPHVSWYNQDMLPAGHRPVKRVAPLPAIIKRCPLMPAGQSNAVVWRLEQGRQPGCCRLKGTVDG